MWCPDQKPVAVADSDFACVFKIAHDLGQVIIERVGIGWSSFKFYNQDR